MFERMSNGWELAKESWHVLRCDKELLLFPLMSGIACVLVMATFAVPLWASGFVESVITEENGEQAGGTIAEVLGYLILFAFYFVNYFVIVFFNAALYLYAADGTVPQQFDDRLFRQAFGHK